MRSLRQGRVRIQRSLGIMTYPTISAKGSKVFLQQNYSQAADSYQKALDLEKQKRTLSKDYFRVLVDNLGMSYGITGKLQQAQATFVFGLTQDPEYPMFHY